MKLLERRGCDAHDGRLFVDETLVGHGHGQTHRRLGRSLARSDLEDVEHPFLNGELNVEHVPVVVLEPVHGR